MHPDFPVYEMLRNGKLSVENAEKLNPAKWKYPELTKQNEVGPLTWYVWLMLTSEYFHTRQAKKKLDSSGNRTLDLR